MEEEKSTSAGGVGGGEPSKVLPKLVTAGDRQLFTVELRPEQTTYVSWRKLTKDANKVNGSTSVPEPPPNAHPNLESRLAPGHPSEMVVKDEPPANRFSAVIEKIERLYMGKDSSDEEELDNAPDDDQYDTEDSFIDDAELDEYFEVDNSAVKHEGFFVNRGKLERINEPPIIPNQQPKKRRRKDLTKAHDETDDARTSNKQLKVAKMEVDKTAPVLGKVSTNPAQNLAMVSEYGDVKVQNQLNVSGISSKKKSTDVKMMLDPSSSSKVSNGNTSLSVADARNTEKLKTGVSQPKNVLSNKSKDANTSSDAVHQKYVDKSAYPQPNLQTGRQSNHVDEWEASVRQKEKSGARELPDVNASEGRYPMQTIKTSHTHKRDGSSVKAKSSMLERAIRELERMVVESRPPSGTENQEADISCQAVKRRLPREIKLKLAKVARIAQASQGKVSKELLSRLMSILGHLIQLRTLKRNLKIMINTGLSIKQEKDDKFQQIKKEVVEMIKARGPSIESKGFEQQAGASDDFQEVGSEEKAPLKKKVSMDAAMEDKICDLYDLYVDGLDDDAGPQIRKLYVELAELWPNGLMDNHGIKRAICRAKERRRALYMRHKDQENIKRKKMLTPRLEDAARAEGSSIVQQQLREKVLTDTGSHSSSSANKTVSSTTSNAVQMPSPSTNGPNLDRSKQEKLKGTSSNPVDEAKMADGVLMKKKVKRKPELELEESHFRPAKLTAQSGEEMHKPMKQDAPFPQRSNLQLTAFNPSS